jgi:hypothetical protein
MACRDGGTDSASLGAPTPSASSATPPPAFPAGDAAPDGPTSNGGLARWSVGLGGAQTDVGFSLAGDAAGDVVAAGSFQGTANLGGVPMNRTGGNDVLVAKYAPDGKPQWVRTSAVRATTW